MRLLDKVAIVTGSSRGIGEAIATRLCIEGAKVVINGTDLPRAQSVSARLNGNGQKTIAVKANVGDKTEVDEMVKTTLKAFGKVDILVNNAGMSVVGASIDLEESRWRIGMDVMLNGVFFCSQGSRQRNDKAKIRQDH